MNFEKLTVQELEDFVLVNASDADKMLAYAKFLGSKKGSAIDAGLASSVNSDVQNAQREEAPEKNEADNINDSAMVENVQLGHSPDTTEQSKQTTQAVTAKSGEAVNSAKMSSAVNTKKDQSPKIPLIYKREYYSLKDVAASFGIGVSSMHKLRQEGHIVGFLLAGKWMFTREQIEEFELRLTTGQITK